MRYLFIAFLFVSKFGYSQGIEPSSLQGNPNLGGYLKGVTLHVDDFGDTTYLYTHVDSTSVQDSIYTTNDTLRLRDGSGLVKMGYDTIIKFASTGNIENVYYAKNRYSDISSEIEDRNTEYMFNDHPDGIGFEVRNNYNEPAQVIYELLLDTTTAFQEYFDPYVIGVDTVGVILKNTNDTLHFITGGALSTPESTTVGDTPTIDMTLTGYNITSNVIDGSITAAKLADTYIITETDPTIASQTGNSGKYLTTNGTTTSWATVTSGGPDSTNVINSYGTIITESPLNTFNIKVDSSKFATTYDLTQVASSPQWASLNYGTTLYGNTQTLTADTYTTINYLGSTESSASIIDANHTNDEIEFVTSGTYRIDYKINFIANADGLISSRVYSSTLAAAITPLNADGDSDSGFKNCTLLNSHIYVGTAGEKIKLQIYPVGVTHTSVGINSFFIVTKL